MTPEDRRAAVRAELELGDLLEVLDAIEDGDEDEISLDGRDTEAVIAARDRARESREVLLRALYPRSNDGTPGVDAH